VAAFGDPHELRIKHVTQLKPLLKPDDRERRVLAEATAISARKGEGGASKPQDVIRLLAAAADPPKKPGSPKRSGSTGEVFTAAGGAPVLRIDGRKRREVTLTLLLAGGASRSEAEAALRSLLDSYWPASSDA
jgi:ParB family chromosome partitioning protein